MKTNKVYAFIPSHICLVLLVMFLITTDLRPAYSTSLSNVSVINGKWSTEYDYSSHRKTGVIEYDSPFECFEIQNSEYTLLETYLRDVRSTNVSLNNGVFASCMTHQASGSNIYFGYPETCIIPFSYGSPWCYEYTDKGYYSVRAGSHTVLHEYVSGSSSGTNFSMYSGRSELRLKTNLDPSKKRKLLLRGTLDILGNSDFSPFDFKINNSSPSSLSGVYYQDDRGLYRWFGRAEWNFEFDNDNSYFDLVVHMPNGDGTLDLMNIEAAVVKQICDIKIDTLTGTSKLLNPKSGGSVSIKGSISDSSGKPIIWSLGVLDKTITGSGKSVNATWDGKYTNGTVVEGGQYSAVLTAQTSDGLCADSKNVDVTVTEAKDGQCGLYVQFGSSAHMASGNLSHTQTLFSTRGGISTLQMTLNYNSLDPANSSLGRGWSHSYDLSLKENSNGSVLVLEGNWLSNYFTLSNGVYTGQPGNSAALAKNVDGSFILTHKDGQEYTFANGKITNIVDRNGNTTTFTYSGSNLATVTDPSGRTISFVYDAVNHLTSVTDPSGNAYVFTVGDSLTSVTQPDGGTWRYSYDANSFMLTKADPLGNVTGYTYDDQHRVTTSTDPEGKTRSITYPLTSETVKSTSFTEKDGGVWNYSYDTQSGYLLSKTDPQGGTTSYGYDTNGNRIATTNPDGTTTSATYDGIGNILTSTDALGQITGYTYNSFGQVTGINDAQGGTTAYDYDAKGNLTTLTDSFGTTTQYAYDGKGNISKVVDAAGLVTSFTYNANGNLATVTDSSGATSSFSYDAAGNVTSSTDAKGEVTQFIYDSRNRLIKSIDPNGNATVYSYDANGNRLSDTDANGNITKYEYNGKNQLIKTTDALNNSTTYSYGGSSCPSCGGGNGEKLTTLTDANGNSTSYLYDQLGRLSKETDPKGNANSYDYDAKGKLTSKTDANGNMISYGYDGNGRLLKKRYPDNTEEAFTYDPKGNILSASNKDIAYNFSYDAAGRMTSSMDSNSRYLLYSYDTTGRKTKTIYPEGSVVSYAYDNAGRLATITNGGGRTYGYSYDKLGRRNKLTYPSGATASYGYDTAGRLTNLDHKTSSNKIITSFSYTHDKVGNRLTKTEPEVTYNYGYDSVYRLLQAIPAKPHGRDDEQEHKGENYSYDPVGNRLTGPRKHATYAYGPGNELLTARHLQFGYDMNGNQIEKARLHQEEHNKGEHHDHYGDHHDGKKWTYTYDFENRLIKAETTHEHEATVVTFKYGPFGRRIEKKVEEIEHGKAKNSTVHTYVYDGQAIILEYETSGEGRKAKTEATKYIHGPGIDEPLSLQRNNEIYYYHSDGIGSITALTDKKQKVVESYEYDSFGNLKDRDNKPTQPFLYAARERDAETGLYFNRARYYDPMQGRFVSKDPIGFKGGINVFAYVQNNPVNFTDPFGWSPGDKFDSADLASIDAIDSIISQSSKLNKEFGGFIYKNKKDCSYSYTGAVAGAANNIRVSTFYKPPGGNDTVAIYHTHPGTGYNVHYFSTDDYMVSGVMGIDIYMGTIFGRIKVWDPRAGIERRVR